MTPNAPLLPRLMLVTQSPLMQPDFQSALEAALKGGARLIQLRERGLPSSKVLLLAQKARRLCSEYGARLLINSDFELAREVEADGVHLRESQSVIEAREFLGQKYLLGQSTHSVEAAKNAEEAGADYLVFGSVFATQTHPGAAPAGVEALRQITGSVKIPVYAIGGITPENCAECRSAKAHGIAVIRAVWQAAQIGEAVAEFNSTLSALE